MNEFISGRPRPFNVKSTGVTHVAKLNYNDFYDNIKNFSTDYEKYIMMVDEILV